MDRHDTAGLLALRKLTRAVSDLLRSQMKEYLSTMAPLLHPRTALGSYIEGSTFDSSRPGEKAFKELQEQYLLVARSRAYNLPPDFKTPLEVINPQLEMSPVEYTRVVTVGDREKTIVVTSPLKWSLSYAGFGPTRLRSLLDTKRTGDELQQTVLHTLMMNTVVSRQAGIRKMLDSLHFPLVTERTEEFGDLPLTYVTCSISTKLLPDEVIIESTEISGMDAFEEVVNTDDVARMRDPLKEQLTEMIKAK